ncbi:hypothetical protein [Embleya sp. MST-111070]|uniref:hypothetical protein n=1 Tax=Embleya sp. MST-111070 TaxID=3398231 RepID=UPI003F73E93C
MIDTRADWDHVVLDAAFAAEGCCFADMDGDGEDDLVAGEHWWKLDGSATPTRFRGVADAWLPPWGGGDRPDPHAHLREGGGPAQYKAATYDWPLPGPTGSTDTLVSVGMHRDPVLRHLPPAAPGQPWTTHEVTRGGIYESAILTVLDEHATVGLVTVPDRPRVAWYEPGPDPRTPWTPHTVGEHGGNWHGLGVGRLDTGGPTHILTAHGTYRPGTDIRRPWHWSTLAHLDDDGALHPGLGDVAAIHPHPVAAHCPSLFAASPHARGLWRFDLLEHTPGHRLYRRRTLEDTVSQLHALAVLDAVDGEDADAWVITGKRRHAHGRDHDVDPNGPALLFRVAVHADAERHPRLELIDDHSGVGLQFAARRLPDARMQIATANKNGTHLFTQRKGPS